MLNKNREMTYKKITLITALIWSAITLIILISCSPKTNCGTKGQHKARIKNSKKMAPSMMH